MNTTTNIVDTKSSAPEWLRELTTAKTGYEEDRGWPVSVDVSHRRLVIRTGAVVDAVTMPAALGEKVLAELQITMLAGPVTTVPPGAWWTFLTQPATAVRPEVPSALRTLKVRCTPRSATAVIPTHPDATDTTACRWIQLPRRDRPLPAWSTVIGATRRVAEAQRTALAADHTGQHSPVS